MTKLSLLIAILLSGMLCLTGCGGGDDDNGDASASASGSSSGSAPAAAPAADPGSTVGAPPVDVAGDLFAATIPSGLKMVDKRPFGAGQIYYIECDSIPEATQYVFTISYGETKTAPVPDTFFLNNGPDNIFTVSVYALNGNGVQSKTASAEINN